MGGVVLVTVRKLTVLGKMLGQKFLGDLEIREIFT